MAPFDNSFAYEIKHFELFNCDILKKMRAKQKRGATSDDVLVFIGNPDSQYVYPHDSLLSAMLYLELVDVADKCEVFLSKRQASELSRLCAEAENII